MISDIVIKQTQKELFKLYPDQCNDQKKKEKLDVQVISYF